MIPAPGDHPALPATLYWRVPVHEGDRVRGAYFYKTRNGQFDLRYGSKNYTAGMHVSLDAAMEDFQRHVQSEHASAADGVLVTLGQPVEVNDEEVRGASPRQAAISAR